MKAETLLPKGIQVDIVSCMTTLLMTLYADMHGHSFT